METLREIVLVTCTGQRASTQLERNAVKLVSENRGRGLRLERLDVDRDSDRIRELGVVEYPAMVLSVSGSERARLVGSPSRRRILQTMLPEIWDDEDRALGQLRRQLGSPGEDFPRRVLKRHERVSQRARMDHLGAIPLFASLTRHQLRALAKVSDEVVVESGAVLMHEGDPGDQLYAIVAGQVTARQGGRKIGAWGPGDYFGEMAILDGAPRSATVTVDETCLLLAIDREPFLAMIDGSPEIARTLLATLSSRVRSAQARSHRD